MTPADLLAALAREGVSLEVSAGRLLVTTPSGSLKPKLASALTFQRAEIIELLAAATAPPIAEPAAVCSPENAPADLRDEDDLGLRLELYLSAWPTAAELLPTLRSWGVTLSVSEGRIHAKRPPDSIPADELRALLAHHKAGLLQLLADRTDNQPES